MAKQPPTPPDGISPFERFLREMRSRGEVWADLKKQFLEAEAPGGGLEPGDIVRLGDGRRSATFTIFGLDPGPQDQGPGQSAEAIARQRLEAEERKLREPIAHYLVSIDSGVGFGDVVGNEAAVRAIVEAVEEPVTHGALYAHYGMKPPKGVLLHGPPGCGKTMLAKAAAGAINRLYKSAGEAASSLLLIKGPEIQSVWVGATEQTIRAIFAYAQAFKRLHRRPLVVFIDEADAILPSRSKGRTPWFQESNVATFLAEMDGLKESGALVILATNRPDQMDEALLRPGRIDRKIRVERPDEATAAILFERGFALAPLAPDQSAAALAAAAAQQLFDPLRRLARMTTAKGVDFLTLGSIASGAMVVGLVERAKAIAFRRDLGSGSAGSGIGPGDVTAAIDETLRENAALDHPLAIVEFCQRIEVDGAEVQPIRPRRGGTE